MKKLVAVVGLLGAVSSMTAWSVPDNANQQSDAMHVTAMATCWQNNHDQNQILLPKSKEFYIGGWWSNDAVSWHFDYLGPYHPTPVLAAPHPVQKSANEPSSFYVGGWWSNDAQNWNFGYMGPYKVTPVKGAQRSH